MKIKRLIPGLLMILLIENAVGSDVIVSGTYVDKKQYPIPSANIDYYLYGDILAASTVTSNNGSFSIHVTITETGSLNSGNSTFKLSQNRPNPFSSTTVFDVNIPEAGSLTLYSIQGVEISRIELPDAGNYKLKWGGLDAEGNKVQNGIYLYCLSSAGQMLCNKMTLINEDIASSALEVIDYFEHQHQSTLKLLHENLTTDILLFSKSNTSTLELSIPTPSGDTTLGTVIGNVGPSNIGSIITIVNIDELPQWNLNDYFYNDDQNLYEVDDTVNFEIISDSLLIFIGENTGQYFPNITATDPFDNPLTAIMIADITVTNENVITLSGTYLNKLNNPIANANVFYYQEGINLLGQAITSSSGDFSMSIITTGTTMDTLIFQKIHTTERRLGFYTPSVDTNLGNIIGNIGPTNTGSISETHYTIENNLQWDLNNYFTNDDQSLYSVIGAGFSISGTSLTFTIDMAGTYSGNVTATDPEDASLTANMPVSISIIQTMSIPDFTIPEDTATGILIPDLNVYVDPGYEGTLIYSVVSQSSSTLLNVAVNGNALNLTYLQNDGYGNSLIGLRLADGNIADTCYFTIAVEPYPDLEGYVYHIFDSTLVSGAWVRVEQPGRYDSVQSNADGFFKVQLYQPNSISYLPVTIRKSGFTPFHTWATLIDDYNFTMRFAIIPDTFIWELYAQAFSHTVFYPNARPYSTQHFTHVDEVQVFFDTINTPGYNVDTNCMNQLYNLENILPVFTKDVRSENIRAYKSFPPNYVLPSNTFHISFKNNMTPTGAVSWTSHMARIIKGFVRYKSWIGTYPNPGFNNIVFNQEVGTILGATSEPPQSSNYSTVFSDPASSQTFTSFDLQCSKVYHKRSLCHVRSFLDDWYGNSSNPELFDWELRPDSVALYFTNQYSYDYKDEELIFNLKYIYEDGSSTSMQYPLDSIPKNIINENRDDMDMLLGPDKVNLLLKNAR